MSSRKAKRCRRPLTVRVCDSLSCEMAGARELRGEPAGHRAGVRVVGAPCVGRCEQAPVAVVGQNPVDRADVGVGAQAVDREGASSAVPAPYIGYAAYRARRRLPAAAAMPAPAARRRVGDRGDGGFGPARPRRRGLSGRPQMAHRARRAGAAPDGGQHRRRRARHVQGPLLPRARSAPLPRRHADRRAGRSASPRSTSTCATNTPAAARSSKPSSHGCRPIRPARCRRSNCAAAPAPTSAAKSRR